MTEDGAEGPRARWDLREVNVLVVVALAALTVVPALVGWWYRPGSSAYPMVGRRLALTVQGNVRSLVLNLRRVGLDGAVLTLYDDDRFLLGKGGHGVTTTGWAVGIDGLGAGRVVRHPAGRAVPIPPDDSPMDHDPMPIPPVHGGPTPLLTDVGHQPELTYAPDADAAPLYLRVRWDTKAPVRLDGAYLSAELPSVTVSWPGDAPASVPMTAVLRPVAGDVGRFSLQATTGPSVTAARSWAWQREGATDAGATASGEPRRASFDPIALSAVNVSETQRESVRTFFVGVLLGVAGGAVIGLILELVKIRRLPPAR